MLAIVVISLVLQMDVIVVIATIVQKPYQVIKLYQNHTHTLMKHEFLKWNHKPMLKL